MATTNYYRFVGLYLSCDTCDGVMSICGWCDASLNSAHNYKRNCVDEGTCCYSISLIPFAVIPFSTNTIISAIVLLQVRFL